MEWYFFGVDVQLDSWVKGFKLCERIKLDCFWERLFWTGVNGVWWLFCYCFSFWFWFLAESYVGNVMLVLLRFLMGPFMGWWLLELDWTDIRLCLFLDCELGGEFGGVNFKFGLKTIFLFGLLEIDIALCEQLETHLFLSSGKSGHVDFDVFVGLEEGVFGLGFICRGHCKGRLNNEYFSNLLSKAHKKW